MGPSEDKNPESLRIFSRIGSRCQETATSPPTFQERLATETFVNGIRDGEVKKVLQLSRYQTSSEGFIRALEVEAPYNSSRTYHKVRVAELEMEENDGKKKVLEKLSQQMDAISQRLENDMPRKRSLDIYRCGSQGHLKSDCCAR